MPILADTGCPRYSEGAFTLLNEAKEDDLCTPFRKLFTLTVNAFHRVSLATQPVPLDIDAAWPAAINPSPGARERATSLTGALQRSFFDTRNRKLKFSPRFAEKPANLKPDLVLMLHHNKDANKNQPSVYWKDVRIPIEVKRNFHSEGDIIVQMSGYAEAILMEQFDRKFVITVSLSATHCRLFHWDSVSYHVSELIDIHKNPILFIRCIARLLMMTPAELGYDEHFSNAGRVLSGEEVTTTLIVRESSIRRYLDRELGSEEMPVPSEMARSMLLELDTENFLSESKLEGMLFHRYTRVWRGREVTDVKEWKTGPTRVVKQSWIEDTRHCEGYFYKLTTNIPTICSLVFMEECDRTRTYRSRVAERDVLGCLRATGQKPCQGANTEAEGKLLDFRPNPLQERVLLRFVFEEEYRPLSKASNSLEVLAATVHWIEGLIALDRLGIVHRNISYSNLMLPAIDHGSCAPDRSPNVAKIIDLGLAHRKDPQGSNGLLPRSLGATSSVVAAPTDDQKCLPEALAPQNARAPQQHHPIPGTLPFIALDLTRQLQRRSKTGLIEHALHHDVESVFWVLVYFCLLRAQDSGMALLTDTLDQLISPKIGVVVATKWDIISWREILANFVGPFSELKAFLEAFADYYHECSRNNEPIDAQKVLSIAIEQRDKLAEDAREKSCANDGSPAATDNASSP
ncbi:hypothetical protein FRC01_004139 [Tulasnella sp. 417]|nr:hypothetical protein FRC01_004139 [Tulasnella sp. 417]